MIHKYKLGGYNIVLDVHSGGVHIVDELTYDMLDNVHPPFAEVCPENVIEKLSRFYDREEIISCYEEVKELHKENILFSEDDYEKFAKYSVASPVKAMCLLVAMDCNLRCEYCFAGTGDYCMGRNVMSFETGKKALDFLLENSGNRENLEVDFFGGEPLMNWEVVKQLVEYGRSKEAEYGKKFRFTITTNGMLLDDEKMDFINKEMSNVVMSIDGRKEVNDRVRKRVDGTGCYDRIVERYKRLAEKRHYQNYYVRGTFTKYNLDFSNDVFHLYDLGFDQISVEPVVCDHNEKYALTEKELPAIFSEYERLAELMLINEKKGKHFNFFHFMLDLEGGPCVAKRLSGCGSGTEYLAVTPWGDLYPCHQFVGQEEFLMGNVDEGITKPEIADEFRGCSVYSKESCKNCFARFYCSGGCMANSYKFHNTINDTYEVSCEMERKRVECAIMIKAALADEERMEGHEEA